MSKVITVHEARLLGVYHRHCFSRVSENYCGSALYVIQFERGIKVGITQRLKERLSYYRKPWCQEIKAIQCYKHPNPADLESFLKKNFVREAGRPLSSSEFIVGNSFEYLIRFIERNGFYTGSTNRPQYIEKMKIIPKESKV